MIVWSFCFDVKLNGFHSVCMEKCACVRVSAYVIFHYSSTVSSSVLKCHRLVTDLLYQLNTVVASNNKHSYFSLIAIKFFRISSFYLPLSTSLSSSSSSSLCIVLQSSVAVCVVPKIWSWYQMVYDCGYVVESATTNSKWYVLYLSLPTCDETRILH